jgi:LuxR family maltose regulon positive regulatory protein
MSQELGGFVWLDMNIDLMFLGHFQITSDFVAFESYWEEQLSKYETISGLREYLCVFLFIKGKALLLQGRLEEAKKIYERMTGLEKPNDLPENMLSRALMSAKIAIYEDQFLMAEGILRQVANIQQQAPYSILFGDARVLLCILYYRWEKIDEAVSELKPTLADYQRLGLPGLLALEAKHLVPLLRMAEERKVDFSVSDFLQILDIQYSDRSVVVSSTGEVLTSREMEVLRLIATGASNHDIASQLVISMPTVKSHVTNILRKLDVKSRTQAVAQARELLIL